jgi:hypothetical protein
VSGAMELRLHRSVREAPELHVGKCDGRPQDDLGGRSIQFPDLSGVQADIAISRAVPKLFQVLLA